MGINYYFIRAVYSWPEIKDNPTFPVRGDSNEWHLNPDFLCVTRIKQLQLAIPCLGKYLLLWRWSLLMLFQVTWLAQYYTAVDVPQVTKWQNCSKVYGFNGTMGQVFKVSPWIHLVRYFLAEQRKIIDQLTSTLNRLIRSLPCQSLPFQIYIYQPASRKS